MWSLINIVVSLTAESMKSVEWRWINYMNLSDGFYKFGRFGILEIFAIFFQTEEREVEF